MGEVIFSIGGLSFYATGFLAVVSYLWGSFVFYKKSLESHFEDEAVFDVIVLSAFWGFLVSRLGFVALNMEIFWKNWSRVFLMGNYPGLDRWGFVLGMCLGVYVIVRKLRLKYVDWLDHMSLGYLAGSSLFWTGLSAINFDWRLVVLGLVYLATFVWFWDLEKKYRLIEWYRAGKTFARTGFISGITSVFLGITYVLEGVLYKNFDFAVGVVSAVLVALGVALVYIRSGRIFNDDINRLKIWKKNKK